MSGGVFIGQLFIQKDFKQPACWWVGLCSFPVGCLAWGIPALEPTGCWVGPGLGEKMAASKSAHAMNIHQNRRHQCPCPCSEPQPLPPPTSAGDPPILAGKSGQSLMRSLLFSLGTVHETLCALSKSGVSVSPSPVEFLWSNPAGLQSQILWGLRLLLPDPQAGEPDVGLRPFTPMGELLWYNCFSVCGLPTQCVWDLILSWLCPSYCLTVASSLSVFGCRVSFLVGSSVYLSVVVQQLVVILVFP